MCPPCEHDSNLLTCSRCGSAHPPEESLIHSSSSRAYGRECQPAAA